ncbi:helix-turn-helix domain-containing protein [Telluria mixta]|uniref:Helix-turn-helix domain-containing protein n=1 Tax=Telluria mixta TaxID=34071 RepID=A0ABT2BXG4_9BURK|nr:helix-turn-helix domain-containing protein [Telluria mixta]MCS0629834.1 helix-turn-helix domain-containing protein [Telluria mixta]WEM96609.1 helix-turn-helix domain-containing protein [Telluria mixta]
MHTWDRISNALGEPVTSVEIGGVPLRAERYIFQLGGCQVPPLDSLVLACHLGGARATAGRSPGRSFDFLAGAATVFQPGFASRWTFFGAIDMAMFHFLDPDHEMVRHLQRLLAARAKSPTFSDPLVHAAAQQLLAEVARSSTPNTGFVERACSLMIEQTCRVLEGKTGRHLPPDALQLGRLQGVLEWIGQNLSSELSNAELAERAGVSESHFRRIFQEAMGMTPHRYVLRLRLERVHELLTRTSFSIARVAAQCGFNSQSHMTACFAAAYGITPARARQQARA